tara:strand:- start:217 stop:672 length:456 start_codon:yes stop_codon:yes gene_type:complete
MARIQLKRGTKANLPTSSMLAGEAHFTTDRGTLHVAVDATSKLSIVPPVEDLTTLASVDGATDLVLIHDSSESSGQKEKKITFNAFKTALNVPESDTDEKTAVVSGGTSGYLYGTDGSDGVIRVHTSMSMTKDSGNAFVTLAVGDIDLGTF